MTQVLGADCNQLGQTRPQDRNQAGGSSLLSNHLSAQRQAKESRRQRHAPIAAERAAAKDSIIQKWSNRAVELKLELSWRQRKELAIINFVDVYAQTRSLSQAYTTTAAEPSIDVTA